MAKDAFHAALERVAAEGLLQGPGDVQPILGSIPLLMLDLVLDPATQTLRANPDNPEQAGT